MARQPIWNFHNPQLSLAQSCLRELIGRATAPDGQSGSWLTRIEAGIRDMFGATGQPGVSGGLASGHPVMQTLGMVLDQIERRKLTEAPQARAAFRVVRAGLPGPQTSAGGLASDCLDLLAEYLLAWVFHDQTQLDEIESEVVCSQCDVRWLSALKAWVAYYWDGSLPLYNPPDESTAPFRLAPGSTAGPVRVGVLGDWGTGEPEALAVLEALMQQKPDLIIHLGDIYYAGTHDECQVNFLAPIRAARRKYQHDVPVYSIPGNHDYHCGGGGFYAMVPQLNQGIPNASVQAHSFLCLRNEHWQLECLDTGYNDHNLLKAAADTTTLRPDEAAWHQKQLSEAGPRQVILLSHHQLFSAFTTIGASGTSFQNPLLIKNLQDWRAAGAPQIAGWFWGHEHVLEIYAVAGPGPGSLPVLGRCVGHGAFPVFKNTGAYRPAAGAAHIPLETASKFPNGYVQTGDDGLVYANGYIILTLGAGSGRADYYQVNDPVGGAGPSSQLLWSEPLPASPSAD